MRLITAGERERRHRNLLARIVIQDPQAIADCFDLYGSVLYLLIKGIVKKASLADLLIQECFLRAWNRATQLREDEDVGAWLAEIARECASDHASSSAWRDGQATSKLPEPFPPAVAGLRSSPGQTLIDKALRELSRREKRIVDLAFYRGLSQPAIAREIQQPLGEVERLAAAGRISLSRSLDPYLVNVILCKRS